MLRKFYILQNCLTLKYQLNSFKKLFCLNYSDNLLQINNLSSVNIRYFWGRNLKPGEISPGIKAKDVAKAKQSFEVPDRDKQTYLSIVDNARLHYYLKRQGYAEFVTAALPYMKDFGVHRDLTSYKALMNVFPRDGRFAPTSLLQAGFQHYILQQRAAVQLLDQMEYNRVLPDLEMQEMVLEIFGMQSSVMRKLGRMAYWMSKLKNKDPFPISEDELPLDSFQLAIVAMKRMCIDQQTKISVFKTKQVEDSIDDTWIVSAQSPAQQDIIKNLLSQESVFVEGPFRIWLRNLSLSYFQLRASVNSNEVPQQEDEDENNDVSRIPLNIFGGKNRNEALAPQRNLHIQQDGKYLAFCITGTSSRDSLLSWIRLLQLSNDNLKNVQVVFTLKSPSDQIQIVDKPLNNNYNENVNQNYN